MKEIVILSGKGGTGKSSLTASFAALAGRVVAADADVDAADLSILIKPVETAVHPFESGHIAKIDPARCIGCGECMKRCRFDAIISQGSYYQVAATGGEGCGGCVYCCPVKAIDFPDRLCGEWYESTTDTGYLVHAKLFAGAENSGKLVSTVRREAVRIAQEQQIDLVLIDGPPGTGCSVIASVTGVNSVVFVTEPTPSGLHDLKRVASLVAHFRIPGCVIVNRADINPDTTAEIELFARNNGLIFAGKIPYSPFFNLAQRAGLAVPLYAPESVESVLIREIWGKINCVV